MEKSSRKKTSFSSMILDEVSRSMDGNDERFYGERNGWAKKISQGNASGRSSAAKAKAKADSVVQDEIDCWVEPMMEKQANDKVSSGRNLAMLLQLDDLYCPPLSSGAASSSSSACSSAELPSSDIEFVPAAESRKFYSSTTKAKKHKSTELSMAYHTGKKSNTKGEPQKKSKCKALNINAKKMEVLGPLTRLIKHLKIKKLICFRGHHKDGHLERHPKHNSRQGTFTGPSSSSFPNSYLSHGSRPSFNMNGAKRRRKVRFHPVSVIVDEHGRPSGHKRINDQNPDKFVIGSAATPLPGNATEPKTGVAGLLDLNKKNDHDQAEMNYSLKTETKWTSDKNANLGKNPDKSATPLPGNATEPKTGVAGLLDLTKTNDHDQAEMKGSLKMETKRISDKNGNLGKVGGVDGDEENKACDSNGNHLALVGKIELMRNNSPIMKLVFEARAELNNFHSNLFLSYNPIFTNTDL